MSVREHGLGGFGTAYRKRLRPFLVVSGGRVRVSGDASAQHAAPRHSTGEFATECVA